MHCLSWSRAIGHRKVSNLPMLGAMNNIYYGALAGQGRDIVAMRWVHRAYSSRPDQT
jgi:hypothetical protein